MTDPAPLDPTASGSGEHAARTELPPWVRKVLVGMGLAGPFVGWLIGFLTTPEDANPLDLVREVLSAATGPFGATILAVLAAGALAWHHIRTLGKHEQERKDRSATTARVAERGEQRVQDKDKKIEAAHEKTLQVFSGTVTNYERTLSEMNARSDVQSQQLLEIRTELKALNEKIERLAR